MKTTDLYLNFVLAAFVSATSHAEHRTSTNYNISTDTNSSGGTRCTSAAYSNDGSLGGIAGVSTVASPADTAKHGYIGQLYEVTALQLAATPATVNEGAMRQLSGAQLLDDFTTVVVPPASITWSIRSGPLSSINSNGLATAATVYQDTAATVQGVYSGNTALLGLAVLDTIPDNFGSYADDSIADGWQVQYFGLNNPNAGPLIDPDFDGLVNLLEWAIALNPTLASVFQNQAVKNGSNFEFTYLRSNAALAQGLGFLVEWSDTLPNPLPWNTAGVTETILSDNGTVQQVKASVPTGGGTKRFMHLRIVGQ